MTKDEDNLELKRMLNKMTRAEIKGLALYMCDDEMDVKYYDFDKLKKCLAGRIDNEKK